MTFIEQNKLISCHFDHPTNLQNVERKKQCQTLHDDWLGRSLRMPIVTSCCSCPLWCHTRYMLHLRPVYVRCLSRILLSMRRRSGLYVLLCLMVDASLMTNLLLSSQLSSRVHFSSLQHTPSAAHRPSPVTPQTAPSTSHGTRISFSWRHASVSAVLMKHPIDGPQHMLGPKHWPSPSGPQCMHCLCKCVSCVNVLSMDRFPPGGQFRTKHPEHDTARMTHSVATTNCQ
jgi:hypothetical protein